MPQLQWTLTLDRDKKKAICKTFMNLKRNKQKNIVSTMGSMRDQC